MYGMVNVHTELLMFNETDYELYSYGQVNVSIL